MNTKTETEQTIDCDTDPYVPSGWKVEEHQKGGQLKWDASQPGLYFPHSNEGSRLRQELKGKPVLNANVLDYLFENPHSIPEEWRDEKVFFWGTIYRSNYNGDLFVRYLFWGAGYWDWHYHKLDLSFSNNPIVLKASWFFEP